MRHITSRSPRYILIFSIADLTLGNVGGHWLQWLQSPRLKKLVPCLVSELLYGESCIEAQLAQPIAVSGCHKDIDRDDISKRRFYLLCRGYGSMDPMTSASDLPLLALTAGLLDPLPCFLELGKRFPGSVAPHFSNTSALKRCIEVHRAV
jgi:hypothetical protein